MSTQLSISEAQRKHLDQQVLAFVHALTTSRFLSDQYQTLVNHIKRIGQTELQQFQAASARFIVQSLSQIEQRHTNADVLIRRFSQSLSRAVQPVAASQCQDSTLIRHLRAEWTELQQHLLGLMQLQNQLERERLHLIDDLARVHTFLGRLSQLEYLLMGLTIQTQQINWAAMINHPLLENEKSRLSEMFQQKQRTFDVYKVKAIQHAELLKLVIDNHDKTLENFSNIQMVQMTIAQSALWAKGLSVSLSMSRDILDASVDHGDLVGLCHRQQQLLSQLRARIDDDRKNTMQLTELQLPNLSP